MNLIRSTYLKGADDSNSLTPKQVAAWKKILEGPVTSTGERLYVRIVSRA